MAGRVRKIICSFPRQTDSYVFDGLYRSIQLELVPQGNLAERIRAADAGIDGFFTPTGYDSELAIHADGSLKEPAKSMAACTSTKRPSMPTWRSSKPSAVTAGAT